MVAVPSLPAVTLPELPTVAILLSLLLQNTLSPLGVVVAVRLAVSPMLRDTLPVDNSILGLMAAVTVTLQVSLYVVPP